ncbi:MAG: large-conductance mechanosensitive channel protein MscL [Bacteroidia bacterium]|nr:large-conductance mechanosensitive channel protein MscL [Bacteroidia bacterium]MDW8157646.1 large-conductance mechanosensitive channel protein MscL [Bacteroidia bacterium]
MSFFSDFKEFIARGNVVDMATGVIIGAAFGKIVSSLVNDIIMPPIGVLISGVNFRELKLEIQAATLSEKGTVIKEAVTINYGAFLQTVFDFIIIAFVIFSAIRVVNKLKKEKKEQPTASQPEPSKEELLLAEIRDILKSK